MGAGSQPCRSTRLRTGSPPAPWKWVIPGACRETGKRREGSQVGRCPSSVTGGDGPPMPEPLRGTPTWLLRPGEATLLGIVFWPRGSPDTAAAAVPFPGELDTSCTPPISSPGSCSSTGPQGAELQHEPLPHGTVPAASQEDPLIPGKPPQTHSGLRLWGWVPPQDLDAHHLGTWLPPPPGPPAAWGQRGGEGGGAGVHRGVQPAEDPQEMETQFLELCQGLGTVVPWQGGAQDTPLPTEPIPCPTPAPMGAPGASSTSNPVGTLLLGQNTQTQLHHSPWPPPPCPPASPCPCVPLSPCSPISMPPPPSPMPTIPSDLPVLEGCHGGGDGVAVRRG